jgi:hypothetical protein
VVFLAAIVLVVVSLTVSHRDEPRAVA